MEMSEKDVQRKIIRIFCSAQDVYLPNFTPYGWWENDVIRITAAGYWYEYEVKLTRSDFKKDKYKKMGFDYRGKAMGLLRGDHKHAVLARNDGVGPKQFWFVCPNGVIQPEEVPVWAGLAWVAMEYPHFQIKKKAPNRKTRKQDYIFVSRINYNGAKRYVYDFMYGKVKT